MSSFLCNKVLHLSLSHGYFQTFRSIRIHQIPHHHSSFRHFATKKKQQSTNDNSNPVPSPLPHHYTTLNVSPDASIEDIKKSHNLMIKQWHPDLYISKTPAQQQEARNKYDSIREAYSVLIQYKDSGDGSSTTAHRGKLDIIHKAHGQKRATGFTAGRRTPNGSYSYYSWGRKVYETVNDSTESVNTENNGEEEEGTEEGEEGEVKYSETYRENKTWMGRAMEDVYDWMCSVYMRNPSWMQFFMISAACFGLFQGLYHFLYPNVNDTDPDRIWKFRMDNGKFTGFQPSSAAAMATTPSLGALQPHFKGHTLYAHTDGNGGKEKNRYHGESDDDFKDFKADNAFTMFTKLNVNRGSTVNRAGGAGGNIDNGMRKRKRTKYVPLKVEEEQEVDEGKENEGGDLVSVESQNAQDVSEKVSEKRSHNVIDDERIPSELKSSPLGLVLVSHAIQSNEFKQRKEGDDFDWSPIVDQFRVLVKEQTLQ